MHDLNDNYKVTAETFNNAAMVYQQKFMHLDLYNDTYDAFCEMIEKPNASILEIGCGPGNITHYIISKLPHVKVLAVDVAPNMVKLAKENNPTADCEAMDCRNIADLKTKYDAIIWGFCMPYLSKEDSTKLINDCNDLLTNNGILYISTIEGNYANSGYETSSNGKSKAYVYYYQQEFIEQMLKQNNFKISQVFKKVYDQHGKKSIHMIFIAKKY